ncbi:MAG TPA: T9SS type A sorting domain-containing protein [Bacteroidia bacterium]|nr:T9SS type A sorting domain-containing protein [Bacteroidia bacterium]
MKKEIYFLFGLMLVATITHSQSISPSIINSTGGTASVGKYFVDWSVCEVTLASTFSTPNLIVTQGVLQNNVNGDPTGVHDLAVLPKNIKVFPNPSSDIIYLQSEGKSDSKFGYVLLDMNGKVILNKTEGVSLSDKIQEVNLSEFPAGIYILNITELKKGEPITQSYKVQKIN